MLLLLMNIQLNQSTLRINPITGDGGFIKIRIGEVEIVNKTTTLVHVINIIEIEEILNQIKGNIKHLLLHEEIIMQNEIKLIESKIKTLKPIQNRKRRGLINIGGKVYKWLFGTMDDDDRQEILEHLSVTEQNSHNSIETLNKQIIINNSMNKSLHHLKTAVENDRKEISIFLQKIKNTNNEIVKEIIYLDQLTKLKTLEHKIDQIQDNVVSAKSNIIHPSMFTTQEIEKFEIDFYKLRMLKVGIMTYSDHSLIIAVLIPDNYIKTDLKMITPIPNKNKIEIDANDEYIVEIDNQTFAYQDNVPLRKLKITNHCTYYNTCKFNFNNITSILSLDEETIIVKNVFFEKVNQDCDDRKFKLEGNFFINFNNCSITIRNQTFSNKKFIIKEKYFYPNFNKFENLSISNVNPKFTNIITEHFENIKQIEELKFHKTVSYGISATLVIIIVVISVVLYCLIKRNNVKVTIKENVATRGSRAELSGSNEVGEILKKYKS